MRRSVHAACRCSWSTSLDSRVTVRRRHRRSDNLRGEFRDPLEEPSCSDSIRRPQEGRLAECRSARTPRLAPLAWMPAFSPAGPCSGGNERDDAVGVERCIWRQGRRTVRSLRCGKFSKRWPITSRWFSPARRRLCLRAGNDPPICPSQGAGMLLIRAAVQRAPAVAHVLRSEWGWMDS